VDGMIEMKPKNSWGCKAHFRPSLWP